MPATRSAPPLGGAIWNTFTPGTAMTVRELFVQAAQSSDQAGWLRGAVALDPAALLGIPGMARDEEGEYSIDAGRDGLAALALLGAVFPENVVLRRASDDTHPASAGKTGPARFVITLPDER